MDLISLRLYLARACDGQVMLRRAAGLNSLHSAVRHSWNLISGFQDWTVCLIWIIYPCRKNDEPNQKNPIQGTATAKTTQNDLKLCLPFLTPFEHVNRLESIIPNNLVENGKKWNPIIYLHIHGKYLSSLNQLPISSCKKLNLDLHRFWKMYKANSMSRWHVLSNFQHISIASPPMCAPIILSFWEGRDK